MSQIIFNVDEGASTIFFSKIYSAKVTEVWENYTNPELLKLWWMPNPWSFELVSQDFTPGGKIHYAAVGPNGEKHYAGAEYNEITKNRSISLKNFFTDKSGEINQEMPITEWLIGFTGVQDGTKVTINMFFKNQGDLRKILEMGFQEGVEQAANQLQEILRIQRTQ